MSFIPPLPSCEERRDPPALWTLRPANAKLIMEVAPETNALMAHPVLGASVREQWVRWRDSSDAEKGFDVSGLCFLVDTFRPLVEAYGEEGYWFPTMSCSVEVKKGPPKGEKGWEWLFMRIESHQIRYGRVDIDVVILDKEGDLVALSKRTALVVGAERNLKVKGSIAKM
jgi:hypothetical protein